MVGYNLTGIAINGSTNGLLGLTQGVNTQLMGGSLGTIFLIGLYLVLLTSFFYSTRDWPKSLGTSAFLTFLLSILLLALNLIPNIAMYISLIVAAGSIAFMFKE